MKSAREIVREHFILPFAAENRKNIGTELEFPLVSRGKKAFDKQEALALLEHMLSRGFHVEESDAEGQPAFIGNDDGDCLSFDNSYHNFEFSMEKGESLLLQKKRFDVLFQEVQAYLRPRGFLLCGMGTHPYFPQLKQASVSFPVYRVIQKFLGQFQGEGYHGMADFPAYLSSVQTHLDVSLALLPRALTLFAATDFVRALLFSNSPALNGISGFEETVCFRDYLWEKSGFGSLNANVGKVEGAFRTERDLEDLILKRSMFYRERNGACELIPPVTVEKYFEQADSREEDIRFYLSFQNVEITRRGTLEIRSDCQQPIGEGFCPPAFHLGILQELGEAEKMVFRFLEQEIPKEISTHPHRNQILRDEVIYRYRVPAKREAVHSLLCDLTALAHRGLCKRSLGEEVLLAPLFARAENITCPAKEQLQMRKHGKTQEEIVRVYAGEEAESGKSSNLQNKS